MSVRSNRMTRIWAVAPTWSKGGKQRDEVERRRRSHQARHRVSSRP